MSFQRISIIGSMPFGEQRIGDRGADELVALVLEPVDLDEVRAEVGAAAEAAQRPGDALAAAEEHVSAISCACWLGASTP